MIRFMPDTWLEALVRPVAMALPNGGVYVETIAPDFRFVFVLALALAWLAFRVRARAAAARTLGLLAFCMAAFVPWMATSGNGRYFMPVLLVVGPLCIGLLHHLPLTRRMRVALAALMLAVQAFLLHEVEPWGYWTLAPWREAPAFAIEVPQDLREQPATYVNVSGLSYSLVAPSFHPQSRWTNIASQQGRPEGSADKLRVRELLKNSPRMYLFLRASPGHFAERIDVEMLDAIDLALGEHGIQSDRTRACRLLPSAGLAQIGKLRGEQATSDNHQGFWLCPAILSPAGVKSRRESINPEVEAVLDRVERLCPRMFRPGSAGSSLLPVGVRRFYVESDMRLYVFNDGQVVYKYMRALNPVILGTREEVMAPEFRMDCTGIRGRAGLPWEREI